MKCEQKIMLSNVILEEYIAFKEEVKNLPKKTRDKQDLRFGQRMINKLKTEFNFSFDNDSVIFYEEVPYLAYEMLMMKLFL